MALYVERFILMGPPGAGKGTQAAVVSDRLGVPHIDTGSIIRDNINEQTPLGLEAERYVEKGELVPDELIIRLIEDRLSKEDAADGWLLDGFPRSIAQAEALSRMGPNGGEAVERVVFMDVPEDVLVRRLTSRRVCPVCKSVYNVITMRPKKDGVCDKCGAELIRRTDDNEESIRNRFRVYHEETAPIADYYVARGLLVEVDGAGELGEGTERILSVLEKE